MYRLYMEDICLCIGSLSDCDKYIRKNLCSGYYIVKGDDSMKKQQVMKFWKLDELSEDKFESLLVLGYLTFEDYGVETTVYYDNNNDCIPVNIEIVKNGARNLCGSYFYGTKDQYMRFLSYKL